ncbi:MAG: ATP-binding protein [Phaeodactylibacter sp.]|nr:ATP-binding protein [Phaeodactylibacter sp.]
MLIRFYVENFSSFRNRQSFSMIPGKGTLKSNHKTTPVKGISVLKAAVVFGANASGKSNLIKAINFGKKLVLEDIKPGQKIDYSKFRLNELSIAGNSRLEYELQHNGKNYAYGFVFNKDGIIEEWLYEVTKKSDKKIFVRNGSSFDLSYLISINKQKEEKQFINFIAKGTPDNKLFLNEIRYRKVKENVTDISDITNVLDWFLNSLKVILPEDKYNVGLRFELKDDEKLLKSFEQFLEYFDTGIDGVCLEPISVEKVDIPDFLLKRISDDLLNANSEEKRAAILSDNNTTYFISIINNEVGYHKFMTKHIIDSGKEVLFDTSEESDGTNRIIDFIPLLMDLLQGDNVFIIDEMERSLHPNLIYDLIDLFLAKSTNVNSQMILASHESSLLTQKLLRKDEIWFTVKETDGSTTIHSLEEYNIRFDKKIRKDYLLGRFKAIPKLGNRNNLTVLPNQ